MTRLADIQREQASMAELQDIVSAMRALAGMRLQEAQQALPAIRRYGEAMAHAISTAMQLMPASSSAHGPGRGSRALIVCCSEHGFVGGFNERLIEAMESGLASDDRLFIIGSRGVALAVERGRTVSWSKAMATRVAGAPDLVHALAGELYGRIARGEIGSVDVLFERYEQHDGPAVERRRLLPLDTRPVPRQPAQQAALHYLASPILVEKLVGEYVFALMTEAAVESIASENGARFSAMQSAHDSVSKKQVQLGRFAEEARQSEITSELLDLITGAEALKARGRSMPSGP